MGGVSLPPFFGGGGGFFPFPYVGMGGVIGGVLLPPFFGGWGLLPLPVCWDRGVGADWGGVSLPPLLLGGEVPHSWVWGARPFTLRVGVGGSLSRCFWIWGGGPRPWNPPPFPLVYLGEGPKSQCLAPLGGWGGQTRFPPYFVCVWGGGSMPPLLIWGFCFGGGDENSAKGFLLRAGCVAL